MHLYARKNVINTPYQIPYNGSHNAACPISWRVCSSVLTLPHASTTDLDCGERRYSDNVFHGKTNTSVAREHKGWDKGRLPLMGKPSVCVGKGLPSWPLKCSSSRENITILPCNVWFFLQTVKFMNHFSSALPRRMRASLFYYSNLMKSRRLFLWY